MKGKKYQTNNSIMNTVEANEYTIYHKTKEASVLGQIFAQKYNSTKVIKTFGDKGLNAEFKEVKRINGIT